MLPDFPLVKKRYSKILNRYLWEQINTKDPFLRQIKHRVQHEGNKAIMKTYDGQNDNMKYECLISEFKINSDEIIQEGFLAFKKHIDKMVDNILEQKSKMMFKKLNEITAKTGNVIRGEGRPFTKESILEAMEKIAMEFDTNGNPTNLSIVVSPVMWERLKDEIPKWESDSEFVAKREALLQKKRKEYLDSENNRKLVD